MAGPKLFPYLNDEGVNRWLRSVADGAVREAQARGEPAWFAVPGLRGLVREDPDGRRWHVVHRKMVAELPRREDRPGTSQETAADTPGRAWDCRSQRARRIRR
jgi:hypothetical protein